MARERRTVSVFAVLLVLVGSACSTGRSAQPRVDASVPADSGFVVVPGCISEQDADRDGIADAAEGTNDTDGDGLLDRDDLDSDGDGTSDADENIGTPRCAFRDTDGDGAGDFRDTDSDNDGLSDADERGVYFTDPLIRDSGARDRTDLPRPTRRGRRRRGTRARAIDPGPRSDPS